MPQLWSECNRLGTTKCFLYWVQAVGLLIMKRINNTEQVKCCNHCSAPHLDTFPALLGLQWWTTKKFTATTSFTSFTTTSSHQLCPMTPMPPFVISRNVLYTFAVVLGSVRHNGFQISLWWCMPLWGHTLDCIITRYLERLRKLIP